MARRRNNRRNRGRRGGGGARRAAPNNAVATARTVEMGVSNSPLMVRIGRQIRAQRPSQYASTKTRRSSLLRGGQVDALAERVCSIYDPFCPAATGARYPSEFASNTMTYQSRALLPAIAGAAGAYTFAFSPDVNPAGTIATNAANVYTFPASFSVSDTNYTTWLASVRNVRVVSAGLRFIPQQAVANASAVFMIGTVADLVPQLGGSSYDIGSILTQCADVEVISSAEPFLWTANPRALGAFDLIPQTSATTTTRSGNWPAVLVGTTSASASAVLGSFEMIINLEGEPLSKQGTAMTPAMARELASPSPLVRNVAESLRARLTGFFSGTAQQFSKQAEALARKAVVRAISTRFPGLGGALSLTNAVDVD